MRDEEGGDRPGGGPRTRVARLAFVIGHCGPGGTEQQAAVLVKGLVERGINVDVLILEGGAQGQQFGGARVLQLGQLRRGRLSRALTLVLATMRLGHALRQGRYDAVHAALARAHVVTPLVVRALRLPPVVVVWRRNVGIHRKADGVLARLETWATRLTDAVVCNAKAVEDYWRTDSGSGRSVWHVVPNALESWRFDPPNVIEHPGTRPLLVNVGSLRPVKGQEVFLEAVSMLGDRSAVDVAVIGDGPVRAALHRQAERLGVALELPGHVEDTRPWLAEASLYVHPSRSEGMSNAIAEAMAQGCAVVATDVGGSRELLAGTGVLVPPGDARELADSIERLLASPSSRASMGEAARERAKQHMSVSVVVGRHIEIYEEACACVASPAS